MYSVGWKVKGDEKETQSGFQTADEANAFAKKLTDAAALLKVEFDQKPAGALAIATGHAGPTPEVEHVETAATVTPISKNVAEEAEAEAALKNGGDVPTDEEQAEAVLGGDSDSEPEAKEKKGWFGR